MKRNKVMTVREIMKLTKDNFINNMSNYTYEYISKSFPSIEIALEIYKEGAKEYFYQSSGTPHEYLNIDKYFELYKESHEYIDF